MTYHSWSCECVRQRKPDWCRAFSHADADQQNITDSRPSSSRNKNTNVRRSAQLSVCPELDSITGRFLLHSVTKHSGGTPDERPLSELLHVNIYGSATVYNVVRVASQSICVWTTWSSWLLSSVRCHEARTTHNYSISVIVNVVQCCTLRPAETRC